MEKKIEIKKKNKKHTHAQGNLSSDFFLGCLITKAQIKLCFSGLFFVWLSISLQRQQRQRFRPKRMNECWIDLCFIECWFERDAIRMNIWVSFKMEFEMFFSHFFFILRHSRKQKNFMKIQVDYWAILWIALFSCGFFSFFADHFGANEVQELSSVSSTERFMRDAKQSHNFKAFRTFSLTEVISINCMSRNGVRWWLVANSIEPYRRSSICTLTHCQMN